MVEGARLESALGATLRRFESCPLRSKKYEAPERGLVFFGMGEDGIRSSVLPALLLDAFPRTAII